MKYLDEDELEIDVEYKCVSYDGTHFTATYLGAGLFDNQLSLLGDVRYVLEAVEKNKKYSVRSIADDWMPTMDT